MAATSDRATSHSVVESVSVNEVVLAATCPTREPVPRLGVGRGNMMPAAVESVPTVPPPRGGERRPVAIAGEPDPGGRAALFPLESGCAWDQ